MDAEGMRVCCGGVTTSERLLEVLENSVGRLSQGTLTREAEKLASLSVI
jgi:hypothetical protein